MRRFVVLPLVASALVVPARALASTAHYSGTVNPSGTVGFNAGVRHGVVKKIEGSRGPPPTGITFVRVPIHCDQGDTWFNVLFNYSIPVRAHSFHTTGAEGGTRGKTKITGTFTHHDRRVAGTIHAYGDFAVSGTNCDSGTLNWRARVNTKTARQSRSADRRLSRRGLILDRLEIGP